MKQTIRFIIVIGVFSMLAIAGCGTKEQESAKAPEVAGSPEAQPGSAATDVRNDTIPASTPPTAEATPAKKAAPKKQEVKKAEPKAEPKPEAPRETMVFVPAGSSVTVSLLTHLRTDSNKAGDPFSAKTTEPMDINGVTVFPAGSMVKGHLTEVEEPHRTKGRARLVLNVEKITAPNGKVYDVETKPIVLEAKADAVSDAGKVAIGGVAGGVLGALVSKDKAKGAAIGAVAGAAAGGGVALATKGKQLDLAPGETFGMELAKPAEVSVPKQ
ncbi:MAG: hypothetical protein HZB43_04210 [candidate division Zixibacteria bacterium]|nr:hypothetical protein [candidate division Zixibacteria bacterium]